MIVIAIDPGNVESAIVEIDSFYRPYGAEKLENHAALLRLREMLEGAFLCDSQVFVAVEQVAHYGSGMPAGRTVFDTCVWSGRFIQGLLDVFPLGLFGDDFDEFDEGFVSMIGRKEYVTEFCGSSRAKDSNVIQYLVDRFAPNEHNKGKGTKKDPGWFYGFKADVWQAYALAVYEMDRRLKGEIGNVSQRPAEL